MRELLPAGLAFSQTSGGAHYAAARLALEPRAAAA
jgi:hypothetical protein